MKKPGFEALLRKAPLLRRIEQAIEQRRLFRDRQKIVVAVSGGVDSMVLLNALHQLSSRHRWRLLVAHLNHQLRGRASNGDEQLVRRTASRLGLPSAVERADVRTLARRRKVSVEMAARELRHDFFARKAHAWGTKCVALAHHADDQVELFFLRLLRGAGAEGLGGMAWTNPSPMDTSIELVRPLLDETKASLHQYAAEQKLHYREDASNRSPEILRNRIRNELLPLLKRKYQPGIEQVILRVMELIKAEGDASAQWAKEWLARASFGRRGTLQFDRLPVSVQRRCLQLQLLQQKVLGNFTLVEKLRLKPLRPVCVGRTQIERGGSPLNGRDSMATYKEAVAVSRDELGRVLVIALSAKKFKRSRLELVAQEGQVEFDGLTLEWKISQGKSGQRIPGKPGAEFFDADRVGSQILLRHWQAGDRFQPIGLQSTIKLQDFFTDSKVPRNRRHELILATTASGEVFWVEGMRISEQFKLTKRTKRRLQWIWRRL